MKGSSVLTGLTREQIGALKLLVGILSLDINDARDMSYARSVVERNVNNKEKK